VAAMALFVSLNRIYRYMPLRRRKLYGAFRRATG
jgi:hypothetical protein